MIINIPNFITLGRIMSVPVIFWLLLSGQSKFAFFVFVCAGISDAVDGYLAKRFNWGTELGSYLDPLADKLLIVSIYIALGVRGELPLWLIIMVVSRDILIVVAVLLSVEEPPAAAERRGNLCSQQTEHCGIAVGLMPAGDFIVAFILKSRLPTELGIQSC